MQPITTDEIREELEKAINDYTWQADYHDKKMRAAQVLLKANQDMLENLK